MSDPVIINGPYVNREPVARLYALDGSIIFVWDDSDMSLIQAMIQAIGEPPPKPSLGVGGLLMQSGAIGIALGPNNSNVAIVPQYTYCPAGDVSNQVEAQNYASVISAWNTRAQAIRDIVSSVLSARRSRSS